MSLAHATYFLATDPAFRRALQADPDAAVATHDLPLSPEEWDLLADLRQLLSLSPQDLQGRILKIGAGPKIWCAS